MMKAIKVRLLPTVEQETQLWKSAGTARWTYNWCLDRQIEHFNKTGKLNKISDNDLRKELTQLKKQDEYKWLFDVSNNIAKQAVKDCCKAIDRFHKESKKHGYVYRKSAIKSGRKLTFTDFEDFPRFKSRKYSEPKFYNDNVALLIKKDEVLLENIGWVKLAEINKLPLRLTRKSIKITNPRISFDGLYWYISIGVEQQESKNELTNDLVGIDLGIKNLAVINTFEKPIKNINKTVKVKKLKKRLKRLQRQVSRKYEMNKQDGKFIKTENIVKLEREIKLIHRKLSNIRNNYIHQTTNMIVKTKPSKVVMEDLNVKGMLKNKHLAKAIQEQCFYEFKRQMKYKCEFNGIEFVEADRFYPSSKKCSCCGDIKKDLKLKDRTYICDKCGLVIDRDKNASINLANYKLA